MKHQTIVCLLLAGLPAIPAQAASALGVVSTTGVVWTNNTALPSGSRVWPGDVVRASASGLAVVSDPAIGRFEVRPGAEARFWSDGVELLRGAVASEKLAVVLGEHRILPRDPSDADSWFVVSDDAGERIVAAYGGDVLIHSPGVDPLLVPRGQFATMAAARPPAYENDSPKQGDEDPAQEPKRRRRRTVGASGAGTGSGSWKLGGLGHTASVAVVTGLTAAAVTGVVVVGTSGDETVSPE